MLNDSLLSEIERQQKYLDRLPKNFAFPLFNARYAIESQRRSGYRNSAAASREIVDNAIEASANRIDLVFDLKREGKKEFVNAIAFIDNGSGMLPQMARYALSWGGGTHFDEPHFIGRFGFGLPNASINQTRRVEIYTRTDKKSRFAKAHLDLNEFRDFDMQSIPEPIFSDLPEFVEAYLNRNKIILEHGTIVVWIKPDRLSYRTPANLKQHLIEDFGVTYRYLLKKLDQKIDLIVSGTPVEPVDPLFLMPEGMYYLPPDPDSAVDRGGAQLILDRSIPVKYFQDVDTNEFHLSKIEDESETISNGSLINIGTINVRIARFPLGFARVSSANEDEKRRFEIRKTRKGMSFVRAGREIENIDAFPKSERDKASGLGQWPLLQSYAYYMGVEVKFEPELDEAFGITNDKQGVRPIEDFWRVLAKEGIDDIVNHEYRWQREVRQSQHRKSNLEPTANPSPAELAARDADVANSTRLAVPERARAEAASNEAAEIAKRAEILDLSIEEVRTALRQEAKVRPYKIDYMDVEYGPFYKPEWIGTQIVVFINRQHPFFDIFYAPLIKESGNSQFKEATDILLITLAKAELNAREAELQLWYETQREENWSRFLGTAMKSLRSKRQAPDGPEDEEGEE